MFLALRSKFHCSHIGKRSRLKNAHSCALKEPIVKKTLCITLLLSVFSTATVPVFAAVTGGNPRPQVSLWDELVAEAQTFLGM
jgi:hypothetical protein